MRTEEVYTIIFQQPGSTGYQIWRVLHDRSRAARWFGKDSILSHIFGPSLGSLYLSLVELERHKRVESHWGVATPERGGHRPRHYYALPRG